MRDKVVNDLDRVLTDYEATMRDYEQDMVEWKWAAAALCQMLAKFTHRDAYEILDEVMSLAEKEAASVLEVQEVAAENAVGGSD